MPENTNVRISGAGSADAIDAEIASLAQAEATDRSSTERANTPNAPPDGAASSPARKIPREQRAPLAAAALATLCVVITLFNFGLFSTGDSGPAPPSSEDLAALMDVEVSLLENYRSEYGSYPSESSMAGVETTEGDFYLRVSPDHFKLTLERDGMSMTTDSSTLPRADESSRDGDPTEDF